MRTRSSRFVLLLAALAVIIAGCGGDNWVDNELSLNDTSAAATVNGVTITRSQVDTAVRDILQAAVGDLAEINAEQRAAIIEPLQRQVLSTFIQGEVIKGVADEYGIEVDTDAINAEIDQQIEAQGEEPFAAAIANSDLTIAMLRDVLLPTQDRIDQLSTQLLADKPDVEMRTARHILVETEGEAQLVLAELEGGADFADLAQERSLDDSSAMGGDLGTTPRGVFVPAFDEAVWNNAVGDVVGPVETQFGFHVIEVTGEQQTPATEVTGQQAQLLIAEDIQEIIGGAFLDAEVTVAAGLGEWDGVRGAVMPFDVVGSGGNG